MNICDSAILGLRKIKAILLALFNIYISIFVFMILLELLNNFYPDHIYILRKNKIAEDIDMSSSIILFLKSVLFVPIFEELIFRKPIKNSKLGRIILIIILFFSIFFILFKNLLFFYTTTFYVLVMFLSYCITDKNKSLLFSLIFSSLVFGFLHLNNVKMDKNVPVYIYILNIVPLIILGFRLGKLRLQENTLSSIITHSIFNFISLLPRFFLL